MKKPFQDYVKKWARDHKLDFNDSNIHELIELFLKSEYISRKITVKELAKEIGVDFNTIIRYLRMFGISKTIMDRLNATSRKAGLKDFHYAVFDSMLPITEIIKRLKISNETFYKGRKMLERKYYEQGI